MKLWAPLALLPCLVSLPAAAEELWGWTASGSAYLVFESESAGGRVCRHDVDDLPDDWPEGLTVGPGAACASVKPDAEPSLQKLKKELVADKGRTKSPWGHVVRIDVSQLVIANGSTREHKHDLPSSMVAPKVSGERWRQDGRAVAVAIEHGDPSARSRVVMVLGVDDLLVGGPAGKRHAEALVGDAERLTKRKDWAAAAKKLDRAVVADPESAVARYARAQVEALGGVGRSTMIEQLSWLKERASREPLSKKLLEKGRVDSAFDAWVGEPEVRELLGLPAVSTMDPIARLTERSGQWTLPGAACRTPWISLSFHKGGKVEATVLELCRATRAKRSTKGTLARDAAGTWVLTLPPLESPERPVPLAATIVLDEQYQQLRLEPKDGGPPLGSFEPGAPRLDDAE